MKKLAVIRIRGLRGIKPRIKTTLVSLGLLKVNNCIIIEDSPSYLGMLQLCKDYVAWGEVSAPTVEKLIAKRGETEGKKLKDAVKEGELKDIASKFYSGEKKLEELKVQKVFRLTPPSKGYKDTKLKYPRGASGKRPDIDSLLGRMI